MDERPQSGARKAPSHEEALRRVLSDLTSSQRMAQLHLLTCPACREHAAAALLFSPTSSDAAWAEGEIWENLGRKPAGLRVEHAGEGWEDTEALLAELLDASQSQRLRALKKARFHSLRLLELLLQRAQELQPAEPGEAASLAALAKELVWRARKRAESTEDEELWSAAFSRAANLEGNARRLTGDWKRAESALSFPTNHPTHGDVDEENASGCRYLGLLRWEQGRPVEAEALLRQSVRSYGELESPREEAASRALLGLLTLERGRPDRAAILLQAARAVLPDSRPWLTARTGLGLALALADLGQEARSRQILAETWRQYPAISDEREVMRLYWLEGRLLARLGDGQNAEPLLTAAREQLLAEPSLADGALCSFDLIVLWRRSGRRAEALALRREIEAILPPEPHLQVAWQSAVSPFPEDQDLHLDIPPQLEREATQLLRNLFRDKGYRAEALPFV